MAQQVAQEESIPMEDVDNPDEMPTEVKTKRRNIISPWSNVSEFHKMYNWIYGDMSNNVTWRSAVDELSIWISRRRSQCPAAVYATHAMLTVKLTDDQRQTNEEHLRSLYAFALVRFFNFMSSTIQTHNMRSMYNSAIELGLESFVVDIRHICAHGTELPELSILRSTVDYCLHWLRDYYWSVQGAKMLDADAKCLRHRNKAMQRCAEKVEELFQLYDIAMECHLKRCDNMKDVKSIVHGRRLLTLKNFKKEKNLKKVHDIFDAVLQDMIMTTKSSGSQKQLQRIFAREFMKMKYFFKIVETHKKGLDFEELMDCVQKLFRFLAAYNFIEPILQILLETAEGLHKTDVPLSGVSFWARQIVEGFAIFIRCKKKFNASYEEDSQTKFDHSSLNFGEFSRNVREIYIYSGVNLKRSIIFGDSFQRPWVWHFSRQFLERRVKRINSFTADILPSMLPLVKPQLSSDQIENLNSLISTYLKGDSDIKVIEDEGEKAPSDDSKIYTIEDLRKMEQNTDEISNERVDDQEVLNSSKNIWRNVKDDQFDWSKCPIGRLPWQ